MRLGEDDPPHQPPAPQGFTEGFKEGFNQSFHATLFATTFIFIAFAALWVRIARRNGLLSKLYYIE